MAGFNGWAVAILHGLGAPVTPENLRALQAWQQAEGGSASYNPLNTTEPAHGAGNYNSVGVKNYGSAGQGIAATLATLNNGRYGHIIQLFKSGKATAAQIATAISQSPWGTGAGVLKVLGASPTSGPSPAGPPGPAHAGSAAAQALIQKTLQASGAQMLMQHATENAAGAPPTSSGLMALALARKQAQAALKDFGAQPTTGPLAKSKPGSGAGGFLPQGARYRPGRKDQGHDFQTNPGGSIIAPGNGVVIAVKSDPNGFGPAYPVVHFTSGPYAGHTLYIGHTISALKPGQSFHVGQVISHTGTSPIGNASVPGWAEIGYAPGGTPGAFGQSTPF